MVFHTLPGFNWVIPITSWQLSTWPGRIYLQITLWLESSKEPSSTLFSSLTITTPSSIVKTIIASQEIASVGLTEQEAKNKGIRVITAKQNLYSNARTMIVTKERGFIKVVADLETKKIIGAQLICERAGDIVAELALAINHNLLPEDMLVSIRPHPSYCEAITDVMMLLLEKMR